MQVILLKDIPKIGQKDEVKNVSDGYAINFLFPSKLAQQATAKKIKEISKKKQNQETENKINKNLLIKNIRSLNGARVEIKAKANEKGHLFKGIHIEEIIEELEKQNHIDLKQEYIQLENPIKEIGEFDIVVKTEDAKAVFKLEVISL